MSENTQKIAIVGHNGYLGSFLSTRIENMAHIHRNNHQDIDTYDIIIYLGGLSGRLKCNNNDTAFSQSFDENVCDIMELANHMRPGALLIYASTASLYEGFGASEPSETAVLNTQLFDHYTYSMYLREKNIQTIGHIHTIGLRLGTVVGLSPKQRYNLVHTALLRQAVLFGKVNVFGADQNRAIVWTQDLAEIVQKLVSNSHRYIPGKHTIYNVASFNCTVANIANELACITGCNTQFTSDDNTMNYNIGFSMSTRKIVDDLGIQWQGTNRIIFEDLMRDLEHVCWSPDYLRKWETVKCRICKSEQNMRLIFNFGNQPNANHYLTDPEAQLPEYPLQLCLCTACSHTQIPYTIPPEQMFSDYVYLSGTSQTMRDYFHEFAIKTTTGRPQGGTVLEIACNDGSLLNQYRDLGWKTYGYDPARNLYEISSRNGHNVTVGFWGKDAIPEYPELDIIVAQNVCAHVPDPVAFLAACKRVMTDNTVLYVQTSQANMIELGQFDTAYHEHMSFFTVESMNIAANMAGLELCDVSKVAVHGTSYVFVLQTQRGNYPPIHTHEIYQYEKNIGLYDELMYYIYVEKIRHLKTWIHAKIDEFAKKGVSVVGYGAAAKGMTILNYIGGISRLKYIVDDSPVKQGYFATNNAYPIVSPERLRGDKSDTIVVLVFAWNFIDEICNRVRKLREGKETYLIVPYPQPAVYYVSTSGEKRLIFEEIDTRYYANPTDYTRPSSVFHRTILISHFYNEEALLKYWIRHHAPMFNCAVLINHKSTDASVDIIRREAPSTWNIVDTWLPDFCAVNTDNEVAGYENSFENRDWRLALTTTEFLFTVGFRRKNNPVFAQLDEGVDAIRISSVSLIDDDVGMKSRVNHGTALIKQKHKYYFKSDEDDGKEETEEERYLNNHYNRYMHRMRTMENPYWLGRHNFKYPYVSKPLFILKYLYSPYPEFFSRKLQIRNRMAESNIKEKWGFQHMMEFNDMMQKYNDLKSKPLASISDVSDQLRFFNKYVLGGQYAHVDNEQLLCGIYANLYEM